MMMGTANVLGALTATVSLLVPPVTANSSALKPGKSGWTCEPENAANGRLLPHSGNFLLPASERIDREVAAIALLRDGWDGPGSKSPGVAIISSVKNLLNSLPPSWQTPDVSVATDGELSVSWISDDSYIDVSFFGDQATALIRKDGFPDRVVRNVQKISDLNAEHAQISI